MKTKRKGGKQLSNKATMFDNRQGRICNQNEHIIHRKKKKRKTQINNVVLR
jgi:hypothetical protein